MEYLTERKERIERIERVEKLIPKLKANNKILPLKIECLEWELRALKLEETMCCNIEITNKAVAWLSKMPNKKL